MAYGEDGKNIEDIPRQRSLPEERVKEKEIDRFDEGKPLINSTKLKLHVVVQNTKNLIIQQNYCI